MVNGEVGRGRIDGLRGAYGLSQSEKDIRKGFEITSWIAGRIQMGSSRTKTRAQCARGNFHRRLIASK
ncbi:hypothetical protein P175DRAFT_0555974 [Aspergillus ochraceoroseus IBT 24754]|uniref:Uncharacterized protein n=1 Tax=Aspergillus ochraceoroseus IBT 24754 TaxID=1392256 RepID=A0A2T5M490_9EURO|nr:uncharacterized protein P175DRAFT_0555974 [Aspergillus ochraceoroseus IBT 24754]PTU23326.1 hypothetical protein P175DRAFT_0555974 [Aspergillus ochraceoroseus IBT 24754]